MAPRQRESNDYAIEIRHLAQLERANQAILRRELFQVAELQTQPSIEQPLAIATTGLNGQVAEIQTQTSFEQPIANSTTDLDNQVVEHRPLAINEVPLAIATTGLDGEVEQLRPGASNGPPSIRDLEIEDSVDTTDLDALAVDLAEFDNN